MKLIRNTIAFLAFLSISAFSNPSQEYQALSAKWLEKDMATLEGLLLTKEAAATNPVKESILLMKAFRLWYFEGNLAGAKAIYDSLPTIALVEQNATEEDEQRTAYIQLNQTLIDFEIKQRNKAQAAGVIIPDPNPLIVRESSKIEPPALSVIELATE